ncbi:hypothetical protein L209DRAFT_805381 [Thermothelomyces heterothallicus CBS 203.75]
MFLFSAVSPGNWPTQSRGNISQLRIITVTKFTACSASNIGMLTETVTIPTRNETAISYFPACPQPNYLFLIPSRTLDLAAAEEPDASVTTQTTTATPQEMDNGNHELSPWSENAEPNPVTPSPPSHLWSMCSIDTVIVTTSETSGALVVVSQSCGSIAVNSLPTTITRTSVTLAATDSFATVSETSDFNPFTVRFSENSVYSSARLRRFFTSADSSVAITVPQTVTSTPTPLYPVPSKAAFSESPIVFVASVTYTVPPFSGVKASSSTVTFFNRQQPRFVRGFRSSTIHKVAASSAAPTLGSSAHTPRLTTPRPTSPVVITASESIDETNFAASPPLSASATTGILTYRSLSAAVKAACQPARAGTSITRLHRVQNHRSPSGVVSIVTISHKISFGYGSSTIVELTTKLTVRDSPTISTDLPLPSASFPPFMSSTLITPSLEGSGVHITHLPCPTSVLSWNIRSTVPTHAITYNSASWPSTTFGYVFSQMDSGHGYPAPGYGNPEQIRTVPLSTESFSPNVTDLPVSHSIPVSSALVGHGHNISH